MEGIDIMIEQTVTDIVLSPNYNIDKTIKIAILQMLKITIREVLNGKTFTEADITCINDAIDTLELT
jgi:hypothetical protein